MMQKKCTHPLHVSEAFRHQFLNSIAELDLIITVWWGSFDEMLDTTTRSRKRYYVVCHCSSYRIRLKLIINII